MKRFFSLHKTIVGGALALGLCLAAPLPGAVTLQPANPSDDGDAALGVARMALEKGDYKQALGIFAKEAEAGRPAAVFALGYMHQQGLGLAKSAAVAQSFYRQAAQMGSIPAMYNLAALQLAQNPQSSEGLHMLEKAAGLGSGRAALTLGRLIAEGPEAQKKTAEAEQWMRKALAAPDTKDEAAFTLGILLDPALKGEAARAPEARTLLQESAAAGYQPAMLLMADIFIRDKATAPKAIELLRQASAKGAAEADYRLGVIALEGRLEASDPAKAAPLFQLAGERGHALACNQLATLHQEGKGVPADAAKAYEWFRKAAELGLPMAQFNVGVCLEDGLGVAKNQAEACQWYYQAAMAGYAPAQNRLAIRYQDGAGVMRDLVAARSWMRKAAEHGSEVAVLNYAAMLAAGEGGPRDAAAAGQLYQSLASHGHPVALFGLASLLESGLGSPPDPAKALAMHRLAADKYEPAKERAELLAKTLPADETKKAEAYVKEPKTLFEAP